MVENVTPRTTRAKAWGITSFVSSFFIPLLALVAGIVSLVEGKKETGDSGKGFAITGIILSFVTTFVHFVIISLILIPTYTGLIVNDCIEAVNSADGACMEMTDRAGVIDETIDELANG